MQVRIRDDMNAAADMVNQLEVMRKQIEDQHEGERRQGRRRARRCSDLDKKLIDVELQLLSRTD